MTTAVAEKTGTDAGIPASKPAEPAAAVSTPAEPAKPADTAAAEQKPADGAAEAEKPGGTILTTKLDAEGKPEEAKSETEKPTEIEYDIKAPEGVELDKAAVDEFVDEVAKAAGLTNEQAQAVVDYGVKRQAKLEAEGQKALMNEIQLARDAEWAELKKHPEWGGANWDKTQAEAAKGFLKFADQKEIEFINTHMLGDRGPMITLFAKIARAFGEGSTLGKGTNHAGVGKATTHEDTLRQLYPNSPEMFGDTKE
jgi:hypothetical protein